MESFFVNLTTTILLLSFFLLLRITYLRFKKYGFSVAHAGGAALFFFLGFPIVLDTLFGPGNLSIFKGFYMALNSPEAAVYYNLYITYVVLVFYFYIKKAVNIKRFTFDKDVFLRNVIKFKPLLWFLLVSPVIVVIFVSPRPEAYLDYQVTLLNRDPEFRDAHAYVLKVALLAAVAAGFLLFSVKSKLDTALIGKYLIIILFLFIAFWIDGKRGIFFKFFFVFLVAGILMGKIRPNRIFRYILVGVSILTVIVMLYGKDFGEDNRYGRDGYTSLRLNVGRDHTVKYTLYKEYVEKSMILQYRGQSFLFSSLLFVPRSVWKDKPYPYAVYFTTSVIGAPPEPLGWSFTVCILEEMISNLGFIGMIIAPFFLLWFCKVGDKTNNKFLTIFATLCVVFFLMTQLQAFLPVLILFLVLFFREKFRRIKFN